VRKLKFCTATQSLAVGAVATFTWTTKTNTEWPLELGHSRDALLQYKAIAALMDAWAVAPISKREVIAIVPWTRVKNVQTKTLVVLGSCIALA
jgi:hypothetical protein